MSATEQMPGIDVGSPASLSTCVNGGPGYNKILVQIEDALNLVQVPGAPRPSSFQPAAI
jgi:hypothetical protein